ncbi:MAG: hypothetical protein RIC95_09295 [Vicingaceae bacterium]
MKKMFFHFSFILPALLFVTHQLLQKVYHIKIQLLDNYLDPFCFTALVLPLLQLERSLLFRSKPFTHFESFIYFLFLVLFSEIMLPALDDSFVFDPIDMIAMGLGLLWFNFFHSSTLRIGIHQTI